MSQNNEVINSVRIPKHPRAKHQFWQAAVDKWKASGKTKRTYSEESGLVCSQLKYWIRKLGESHSPSPQPPGKLVPIGVIPTSQGQYIRIKRPNGICIEVPILQDMRRLKSLLEVLGC